LVGASTREVNPKSEGEGQPPEFLGNYVRLPYPGGVARESRYIYARNYEVGNFPLPRDAFVESALKKRCALGELEMLAKHYVEPPTLKSRIAGKALVPYPHVEVELDAELTGRLGGLAWTILNEGPLPDGDRSTTLARLAHLCREDGLTPDEALAVITAADLAWGKFHSRRDGERQLEQMVETAFADWELV
jgi:hypothetical protein